MIHFEKIFLSWFVKTKFLLKKNYNIFRYGKNIFIDPSARISPNARLKIVNGGKIVIGKNCEIHDFAILQTYGGQILIEKNVFIGPYCVIYGHGGVTIGACTKIATQTVIIPSNHRYSSFDQKIYLQGEISRGIIIGEDVWIGSGVKVLDGVTIEKGCVIGAGAVVNKSTVSFGVYVGIPAKKIKSRL